jgi:hypothetical protein
MLIAIVIVFMAFSAWVLTFQLKGLSLILKKIGEHNEGDYTFDEGDLVDTLMCVLDDPQGILGQYDILLPGYDSDLWSTPYNVLAMKGLLYDTWGLGDNAFNDLRERCLARGYSIRQICYLVRRMRSLRITEPTDDLEDNNYE